MYEEHFEHGMWVRQRRGSPVLLWIHGLGESGRCFEAIAAHPALAGTGALIPDLPGYGRSERPPSTASLVEVADHLAGWLAARGGPAPILIGHSMGGVIGVHLAERHPQTLAGLVDVDGNVSMGDCTYSARATAHAPDAFLARGFAEMCAYVDERAPDDPAHASYARSIRLADPRTFHRHAADLVDASAPEDMAARLARLTIPVVYLAGAPGGACPRSRELLDGAGVRRVDISPSGHWPFVDQPDAFAAAIAAIT
jgi:pimeloyl-ACP methyl ester carboxylesterase